MPLKKSGSMDALHNNIKEMVRSGYKPKQAVAASLSNQRKYKKMAMGGMVEDDEYEGMDDGSINAGSDEGEPGQAVYPKGDDDQGLSDNVMMAQELAEGLQASRYGSNDNSVDYEANDEVAGKKMEKPGQKQSEQGMALGNKPDLNWVDDGEEEPMSVEGMSKGAGGADEHRMVSGGGTMGLSEDAKKALMAKKMMRRYGSYSPK